MLVTLSYIISILQFFEFFFFFILILSIRKKFETRNFWRSLTRNLGNIRQLARKNTEWMRTYITRHRVKILSVSSVHLEARRDERQAAVDETQKKAKWRPVVDPAGLRTEARVSRGNAQSLINRAILYVYQRHTSPLRSSFTLNVFPVSPPFPSIDIAIQIQRNNETI